MLINTIIFLNFLIAVISDVYAQVIETRTEEIYQKKATLLLEVEEVLGDLERHSANVLITRSGDIYKKLNEWNGLHNDLKKTVDQQNKSFQRMVTSLNEIVVREVQEKHRETGEAVRALQMKTNGIEQAINRMRWQLDEFVEEIKKDKEMTDETMVER